MYYHYTVDTVSGVEYCDKSAVSPRNFEPTIGRKYLYSEDAETVEAHRERCAKRRLEDEERRKKWYG